MHKTDHNLHTKWDNMTSIVSLDDEASIVQPGQKTKQAHFPNELITLPNSRECKAFLIAEKSEISVVSVAPRDRVIKTKQLYAIGSPRRQKLPERPIN